jgi:cystathionine beta-lyase
MKISTRCVHFDVSTDPWGAIAPPIYQTATFRQPGATEFGEYDYTRTANPTRDLLEQEVAQLEGGKYACAFASGMAAITALTRLVSNGEEIIAGDDLYGGTVRLLEQILTRQGIKVHYADTTDARAVYRVLSTRTKLILIETPSNPLLRISDIRQLAQVAREAGALLAVDNSILSPVLQRPLAIDADIVIHSATKFLCGHSDVTAGAVITNDRSIHERIAFQQNAEGAGLSPFESWLLMRGMKTLALRVERQNQSAAEVARFLKQIPIVRHVYYPGFQDHPGSDIHESQSEGAGSVISFTTGDEELSKKIVEATRLFDIAVSFGSVASTISLPCRMSHASIPTSLKERLAPPADLVRLSIGIEDATDLIQDLEQALLSSSIHVATATRAASG